MDEVMHRKVLRLRQAAERHAPGSLYAERAYWRDVLDVCNHVEQVDRAMGDWARQLARGARGQSDEQTG